MKTAPAGSWRPHTLNWLNQSKFCQETQLLPMVFLRWLSSWFLISKRNTQVHRKETLDLAIHSSCLKAPHDRGCLRVNQVLSREFKVKSRPWLPPSPPPPTSTCLRGMLSLVNGPQTLNKFDMSSQKQTWRVHWLSQSKTNGQYHAFAAPSPLRDWHAGPFPVPMAS